MSPLRMRRNCLEKVFWSVHDVYTATLQRLTTFSPDIVRCSVHTMQTLFLFFCFVWVHVLCRALASQNGKNSLCLFVCHRWVSPCYMNRSTGWSGFRSCFTQTWIIKKSKQMQSLTRGLKQYFGLFWDCREASDYKAPVGHYVCFHQASSTTKEIIAT